MSDTSKDAIDTANRIGNLMVDTLKEHGRDNKSKTEIVDFFLTVFCGKEKANSPYQVGEHVEYLSFRKKKWISARVVELKGINWTHDKSPTEILVQKSDTGTVMSIDKRAWQYKLRKPKLK